jgi:beta-galactosidase
VGHSSVRNGPGDRGDLGRRGRLFAPNPWNSDCSKDIGGANYAVTAQQSTLLPNRVSWDGVTWEAGTLKAECLDAGGNVVATDTKVTGGDPDHIVLEIEPPLVKPDGTAFKIKANGSDAAFVLAKIVDKNGIWVPTASNDVTFAVSGPGNYRGGSDQYVTAGKPVSFHSPLDPELQAEGGLCKVAVRSTFAPGTVTVTATSDGLGQGAATFTTVAP